MYERQTQRAFIMLMVGVLFLGLLVDQPFLTGNPPAVEVNTNQYLMENLRSIPGVTDVKISYARSQARIQLNIKLSANRDELRWIRHEANRVIRNSDPTLQGYVLQVYRPNPPHNTLWPY